MRPANKPTRSNIYHVIREPLASEFFTCAPFLNPWLRPSWFSVGGLWLSGVVRPLHTLAMTTSRLAQFGASLFGSWIAGGVGAFLVWNFIYGIGARVVTDETYQQLHDRIAACGGIAGAVAGLAVVLSLRRPAPGVLIGGHAFATVAGFFGGSVGWQEGLWAYFGALVVFVISVAFRALFRFLSHREYEHNAA